MCSSAHGEPLAEPELKAMIYHVAPDDHQGNILSLYAQHGDLAFDIYAARWPEAGGLAEYHAHYVHCYATREEADDHAAAFGGRVLEVEDADLDVEIDALEFPHPMVRGQIPAQAVRAA